MIVIRNCSGFDELEACVQLQVETWGYDPTDVIPRKAHRVAQKIGGQIMGAFDTEIPGTPAEGSSDSLVGFVLSLPGVKTGNGTPRAYLHSHMLAVREGYRNRGWALGSSWNSARKPCRAASATWNGPSIRWKLRMLTSTCINWVPSFAVTR